MARRRFACWPRLCDDSKLYQDLAIPEIPDDWRSSRSRPARARPRHKLGPGKVAMNSQETSRRVVTIPPIFWKMIIALASGGAVYLMTGLTHQPLVWVVMLSAFLGGVVLV